MSEKLRVDAIDEILAGISVLLDSQSFVTKGKGLLGRTFDLKSAYKQFGVDVPHSEKLRIAVKKPGGGVDVTLLEKDESLISPNKNL